MLRQRQLHGSITVGYSWMYLLLQIYREFKSLQCTLCQPKKNIELFQVIFVAQMMFRINKGDKCMYDNRILSKSTQTDVEPTVISKLKVLFGEGPQQALSVRGQLKEDVSSVIFIGMLFC